MSIRAIIGSFKGKDEDLFALVDRSFTPEETSTLDKVVSWVEKTTPFHTAISSAITSLKTTHERSKKSLKEQHYTPIVQKSLDSKFEKEIQALYKLCTVISENRNVLNKIQQSYKNSIEKLDQKVQVKTPERRNVIMYLAEAIIPEATLSPASAATLSVDDFILLDDSNLDDQVAQKVANTAPTEAKPLTKQKEQALANSRLPFDAL